MNKYQQDVMDHGLFPPTRYQGSKLKLLDWIWASLGHIKAKTVLDLFSGTASVSYLFKTKGMQVTSNDYMLFNQVIADALIVNSSQKLSEEEITRLAPRDNSLAKGFISETFRGIYYTEEENQWLDATIQRIHNMPRSHKQSLALFALYQACLAKRPYNLFHRANLYMRTANVSRGFGNKTTWERPFHEHFSVAARQANLAVFSNKLKHQALQRDYLDVPGSFDLVYMDPPYLNSKGVGVDYFSFYHFLEGLSDYHNWPARLSRKGKHKPLQPMHSAWNKRTTIESAFDAAIDRYKDSVIAISYRGNGTPDVADIMRLLSRHRRRNTTASNADYKYALSHGSGSEVLIISEPHH